MSPWLVCTCLVHVWSRGMFATLAHTVGALKDIFFLKSSSHLFLLVSSHAITSDSVILVIFLKRHSRCISELPSQICSNINVTELWKFIANYKQRGKHIQRKPVFSFYISCPILWGCFFSSLLIWSWVKWFYHLFTSPFCSGCFSIFVWCWTEILGDCLWFIALL